MLMVGIIVIGYGHEVDAQALTRMASERLDGMYVLTCAPALTMDDQLAENELMLVCEPAIDIPRVRSVRLAHAPSNPNIVRLSPPLRWHRDYWHPD